MNLTQAGLLFLFWLTVTSVASWWWMAQSEAHFNRYVDASGMFIGLTTTLLWIGSGYLIETISNMTR